MEPPIEPTANLVRRFVSGSNITAARLSWYLLLLRKQDSGWPELGTVHIISPITYSTSLRSLRQHSGAENEPAPWFSQRHHRALTVDWNLPSLYKER